MITTTTPTGHARNHAALYLTRDYDWGDDAACRSMNNDLFFPPAANTHGWKQQNAQAKAVCARCPVKAECLEYALDTGQKAGVWGGLSEQERKSLRQLPETQAERCWDNQEWIEKQLEAGAVQRDVARKLGVSRSVLCRVIAQFESERAHAVGEVQAA